jgi:hypothetical protein
VNPEDEPMLFAMQVEWMDTDEPQLVCDVATNEDGTESCGEVICSVQHDDTLYALVATAAAHWKEHHG